MHSGGGLHGQKSYDLKHVVLDHVADRPSVIVELSPPLDPELLRHCDLHTFHLIPVPDRLKKAVSETKKKKIEDRLFTEVVVDAKDSRFRKHRMKCGVQLLCRGKIVSKGLLDNDSRIGDAVRLCESLDDTCKKSGGNRQIMRRAVGRAKSHLQSVEGPGFFISAADIAKQLQQFGQGFLIDLASLLLDAIAHALFEMFIGVCGPGDANHGHIQVPMPDHVVKGGEDLLMG